VARPAALAQCHDEIVITAVRASGSDNDPDSDGTGHDPDLHGTGYGRGRPGCQGAVTGTPVRAGPGQARDSDFARL
jgi:hypothetical protein